MTYLVPRPRPHSSLEAAVPVVESDPALATEAAPEPTPQPSSETCLRFLGCSAAHTLHHAAQNPQGEAVLAASPSWYMDVLHPSELPRSATLLWDQANKALWRVAVRLEMEQGGPCNPECPMQLLADSPNEQTNKPA